MSHTISIQQASKQLGELVRALAPGDEIILTDSNDIPVARILPGSTSSHPRQAGSCKGMIEILDDSNDVVLEHFKDYIP